MVSLQVLMSFAIAVLTPEKKPSTYYLSLNSSVQIPSTIAKLCGRLFGRIVGRRRAVVREEPQLRDQQQNRQNQVNRVHPFTGPTL